MIFQRPPLAEEVTSNMVLFVLPYLGGILPGVQAYSFTFG